MDKKAVIVERRMIPDVKEPYGYIYITTNLTNHKKYIGQHSKRSFDQNYYGSGVLLLKAIDKYGKENFISEPIDWAESKEELDQKEIWWIDFLGVVESNDWYNLADGGEGHTSEEAKRFTTDTTRKLLSQRFSGKGNPMYGKGYKLQGKKNGMYHRTHSEEVRKKISALASSRVGELNPFYGRKHTEETKERDRQAHLGLKHTEETKRLFSQQRLGRKWVYNEVSCQERFVTPEEYSFLIKEGWIKGRLPIHLKHIKGGH